MNIIVLALVRLVLIWVRAGRLLHSHISYSCADDSWLTWRDVFTLRSDIVGLGHFQYTVCQRRSWWIWNWLWYQRSRPWARTELPSLVEVRLWPLLSVGLWRSWISALLKLEVRTYIRDIFRRCEILVWYNVEPNDLHALCGVLIAGLRRYIFETKTDVIPPLVGPDR